MIISDVRAAVSGGASELSAQVVFEAWPQKPCRVRFRVDESFGPFLEHGDPFLTGLVLPCMMLGEDLRVEASVSSELLDTIETRTIPLVRNWRPGYGRPRLDVAERRPSPSATAAGVALCFSSGLDSLYSLEKHRDRVTHLVSVRGFDRAVDSDPLWAALCRRGRMVAQEHGAQFVAVESNLRYVGRIRAQRVAKQIGRWHENFYLKVSHGSVLVAVGQCFPHAFGELVIASSHATEALVPWGSHPELDASWSTSALRVEHDGCEADRIEKAKRLAEWHPDRVRMLSVCHDSRRETTENCSRCPKCLITLLALRVTGSSHLADSFAEPLSLARVAAMRIVERNRNRFERMQQAAAVAGDYEAEAALAAVLRRSFGWRRAIGALRSRVTGLRRA